MIIEGIVTTEGEDGQIHLAPMGPWVDPQLQSWTLKPFQSSMTYSNLRRTDRCVFHVIDDSKLLAQATIGRISKIASRLDPNVGYVLEDSCHWYALQLSQWETESPRASVKGTVVKKGVHRPFFGWNRAKHAVVEAAILASRVTMMEPLFLKENLGQLLTLVQKTAGPSEIDAFALLCDYISEDLRSRGVTIDIPSIKTDHG